MTTKVKPIPEGYHTVTPYLIIRGAAKAMEFYKQAFGAKEMFRMEGPGGTIGHAEMQIGDSHIMLADEPPNAENRSPEALGGSPVLLHLYVPDVDAFFAQAIAAGAKVTRPVADQFYGDRSGGFDDPFGHTWYVATHVEDVSKEEIDRRVTALHNKKS
jgi:PhnB protein